MTKKHINIAYIGGGSRQWARHLMSDLAVEKSLSGTVVLHDIDHKAAIDNAIIGNMMMEQEHVDWHFRAEEDLNQALKDADFVFISILPATFDEMEVYVHLPEKYGIYQSVGDTAGPAGIFRSLIMMPIYETFAKAIKAVCPHAWVINFTNPMTMCVQMLYHVFPEIKAFGNCHEVFHVQEILARALKEEKGMIALPRDIKINPKGINHFTWIDYASYKDMDLMPIYDSFVKRYDKEGTHGDDWIHVGPFGSAERVKFDLFKKHNIIAAAGDRHLVEFLPKDMYINDPHMVETWRFYLTPVSLRKQKKAAGNQKASDIISGKTQIHIEPSGEEGLVQVKALLGYASLLTNVNMPNRGQIPNLPLGHVVETNALFRFQDLRPLDAGPMSGFPLEITLRHIKIHQLLLKAFDTKDLSFAKEALHIDPLTSSLSIDDKQKMFDEIVELIKPYLNDYNIS
jgi:galacturan 1,4-alpha-galacturonidase